MQWLNSIFILGKKKMPIPEKFYSRSGHMRIVMNAFEKSNCRVVSLPPKIKRNGQLIVLRSLKTDLRIRLFLFAVTDSARNRPEERRIEITTTYSKGLERVRKYKDIVLGYDHQKKIFVGVDSKRLLYGGKTGNASSFFDKEGLGLASTKKILLRQRLNKLFNTGIEFHAFLKPARLLEYLFNSDSIHEGNYPGNGEFSAANKHENKFPFWNSKLIKNDEVVILECPSSRRKLIKIPHKEIEEFESGIHLTRKKKLISPEKLTELQKRMMENGLLGEEFVFNKEKDFLRKKNRGDLANKTKWISKEAVNTGYDILSFNPDGEKKYIEVKSTSGSSRTFHMSDQEWQVCREKGRKYYVHRVINVRKKPTISKILKNPSDLERQGLITKTTEGWLVSFKK